jgi:hypothetical protein
LRWDDNWQPAEGEIVVTTSGTLPGNFFAGQPVEISGVIARPPPPLAEGLFNYRDYLQTCGIYYQLKTGSTNDWQIGASSLARPPLPAQNSTAMLIRSCPLHQLFVNGVNSLIVGKSELSSQRINIANQTKSISNRSKSFFIFVGSLADRIEQNFC